MIGSRLLLCWGYKAIAVVLFCCALAGCDKHLPDDSELFQIQFSLDKDGALKGLETTAKPPNILTNTFDPTPGIEFDDMNGGRGKVYIAYDYDAGVWALKVSSTLRGSYRVALTFKDGDQPNQVWTVVKCDGEKVLKTGRYQVGTNAR